MAEPVMVLGGLLVASVAATCLVSLCWATTRLELSDCRERLEDLQDTARRLVDDAGNLRARLREVRTERDELLREKAARERLVAHFIAEDVKANSARCKVHKAGQVHSHPAKPASDSPVLPKSEALGTPSEPLLNPVHPLSPFNPANAPSVSEFRSECEQRYSSPEPSGSDSSSSSSPCGE